MKLYELSESYTTLLEKIESGELQAEDLKDTLEAIEEAIEMKVENIAKIVKATEGEAEIIKLEEKRLAEKRKALENSTQRLKQYAEDELIKTGIQKVKGKLFTIALQKNPPSVEVLNESDIPEDYFRIVTQKSIDKKSILEVLKAGDSVPGVSLKQTESLRIS